MRDHRKLRVFELADEVVLLIYRATRKSIREEVYGLTSYSRTAYSLNNLTSYNKTIIRTMVFFAVL